MARSKGERIGSLEEIIPSLLAPIDLERLGGEVELLEAKVPKDWPPELMAEDQAAFAARHEGDSELAGWLNWFVVRVGRTRTLVGGCGLGGAPNDAGDVMIGYAMLPAFQKKGYATEAVGALIDWAFEDPRTRGIVGQTYDYLVPSIKVMERNGLTLVAKGPEAGLLTYALRRT